MKRTFRAAVITADDDMDIIASIGFVPDDIVPGTHADEITGNVSFAGQKVEFRSDGSGRIVVSVSAMLAPGMKRHPGANEIWMEIRTGHSLRNDGIVINPPDHWVVSGLSHNGGHTKFPDPETVREKFRDITARLAYLRGKRDEFMLTTGAKPGRPRPRGPAPRMS